MAIYTTEIYDMRWQQASAAEGDKVYISAYLQVPGTPPTRLAGFVVDLYIFEAGFDPGPSADPAQRDAAVTTSSTGLILYGFQTQAGDAGKTFRCRAIFRETEVL